MLVEKATRGVCANFAGDGISLSLAGKDRTAKRNSVDREDRASRFAELEREVRALHSYETPEIVAVPITDGSEPTWNGCRTSVTTELD